MKLHAHGRCVEIGWGDGTDHIPRQIVGKQDFYERALLDDAYDRAPEGLIVDAGAHIGNHTLFFAGVMGRQVVAIEPDPGNWVDLMANVGRNGLWPLVTAHRQALGPWVGKGSLRQAMEGNTGSTRVAFDDAGEVEVVTLDSLHLNPAVLKIDVEGQAMAVLSGAVQTLERCRPLVYVETDDDPRVSELLERLGYRHIGWMGATPTHIWEPA